MIELRVTIADEEVLRKIKNASDKFQEKITQAVAIAAMNVRNTAVEKIQHGPKTGRVYKKRRRVHQASAQGEWPASDTGRLAGSIRINSFPLSAEAGTEVLYGKFLENKDPAHGGRPWLSRSYDENKEKISHIIDEALKGLFE